MWIQTAGFLLFFASLAGAQAGRAPAARSKPKVGDIRVSVTGFENDNGILRCSLYSSAEDFLVNREKAIRVTSRIALRKATCVFAGVAAGTYAVAVYHDADGDGSLKRGAYGIPEEAFGASNDALGYMGPPRFEDAKFVFSGGGLDLGVKVR